VKARWVVLLLVAALVVTPAAAGAARTERLRYTPFAADGSLRVGLTAVNRDGTCFTTSSLVAGRQGVFRCITGNLLRDPCYLDPRSEPAGSPDVICPNAPWRRTVVRIVVGGLPGDAPVGTRGRLWALELADGAQCVFGTGASNVVGGYRLNYFCSHHRFLFGSPRRSAATWLIRESRSTDGRRMRLVAIRRAWT
jgi:hypothetical protein